MDVEANSGAEESGLSLLNVALQMRSLEAVQLDLDTVNTQADCALQQLEHGQIHQYYLERRNYGIQSIPGFWITALRNYPQLFEMITGLRCGNVKIQNQPGGEGVFLGQAAGSSSFEETPSSETLRSSRTTRSDSLAKWYHSPLQSYGALAMNLSPSLMGTRMPFVVSSPSFQTTTIQSVTGLHRLSKRTSGQIHCNTIPYMQGPLEPNVTR
ncbi:testis-specific Y-encoded-like protein 6 [Peromyscus eremicus]|uniref:testis-specific Y-encoded-like protein 6 n=1 Tax=Peromyscus eremicus TaxID=42410 RepID=UPI0027DE75A6|nr:testis-specific Y-encoded-like protein 6 [Peromyscus eremicus]